MEGAIYKLYIVGGHSFELRYGYYDECERGIVEPLPLFPDLITTPAFTPEGFPIVTSLQTPCLYYTPYNYLRKEDWCGDCKYYTGGKDEIGICHCRERMKGGVR